MMNTNLKQDQAIVEAAVTAVNNIPIVDSLLEVVCRTTGMGFAAVARVTEDRWIACCVRDEISFGLTPGGELPVKSTICDEIRQSHEPVVIDHVSKDELFAMHHTPAMYGFQSYISVPIMLRNGDFFGTLCAIDPNPHSVKTPETMGMFRLFSELISFHLNAAEELRLAEERLEEGRRITLLREQFIAILGHDLRNPLTAVSTSAQLLLHTSKDEPVARIAQVIRNSAHRISGLIENMLDFAMGHLGEGIVLNRSSNNTLEQTLQNVVTEIQVSQPDHTIETRFGLSEPVYCDGNRIAQLFSNLLRNAVTYGRSDTPVIVAASVGEGKFILSVINQGTRISEETLSKLFQPYSRGDSQSGQQGLGLGLYIAAEIARAHDGTLIAFSDDEVTSFTLEMPKAP
jgi:signal transduction histidine kinase